MQKKETRVIFRFLLVGGSSTLLDYVIYWLLSSVINYNIAKCVSMTFSCVYSFFLNKNFTFGDSRSVSVGHIVRFVLSQFVNIGVNVSVNALVYGATQIKILGMVCATAIAMIVNFLLQRFFVFNREKEQEVDSK